MARFRHLHAAEGYDWQHGRPLGWSEWATSDPTKVGTTTGMYGDPLNDIADHISAIVHHGEKRYGLEVMPNHYDSENPWTWGIHEFRNTPSSAWDDPDFPEKHKGEWLNWTSPGEWDHPKGTPAKYYGHADDPFEAMKAAQDDWEAHKAHVDSQNLLKGGGGYDINQIMRDEGFR